MIIKMYKFKVAWKSYYSCKSCLICKHCTDIFYDNKGPYLTLCDIRKEAYFEDCNDYEVDLNRCEECNMDTNDLYGNEVVAWLKRKNTIDNLYGKGVDAWLKKENTTD